MEGKETNGGGGGGDGSENLLADKEGKGGRGICTEKKKRINGAKLVETLGQGEEE